MLETNASPTGAYTPGSLLLPDMLAMCCATHTYEQSQRLPTWTERSKRRAQHSIPGNKFQTQIC